MDTYAVEFNAKMIIEVEASNMDAAKALIAQAFNTYRAYDPLSNVDVALDKNAEIYGKIRMTVIDESHDIKAQKV
jgi:hypothetical protein